MYITPEGKLTLQTFTQVKTNSKPLIQSVPPLRIFEKHTWVVSSLLREYEFTFDWTFSIKITLFYHGNIYVSDNCNIKSPCHFHILYHYYLEDAVELWPAFKLFYYLSSQPVKSSC
ncbi:UNKNOWN [Stylonychia lemnae]|uniref:Uncharacterized protein n=1 Tax=Stylonychia lemnae TaxID=5949 RepID=A0A078AY23_STYLE|nr:UNKNOWN [Stylonychia lemnae]|eukprot:CDW87021.1 UNKNOWN [Stylonychia lemnae]